jgi:hypothetical protein
MTKPTKTITWNRFIKLIGTSDVRQLEGVDQTPRITVVGKDAELVRVQWADDDFQEFVFEISAKYNRCPHVEGNFVHVVTVPDPRTEDVQEEIAFSFFTLAAITP